jgi:hypothetical protein
VFGAELAVAAGGAAFFGCARAGVAIAVAMAVAMAVAANNASRRAGDDRRSIERMGDLKGW